MVIRADFLGENASGNNDEYYGDKRKKGHNGVEHHHYNNYTDELEELHHRLLGDTKNKLLKRC